MANGYSRRTLRELAVIIFSRWVMIVLITAIIASATILACLFSKKIYRSSVTLWARQSKSTNPLADKPDPLSRLEVFLKTQHKIITSDIVLRRVLVRLDDASLTQSPPDPNIVEGADKDAWQNWYDKVSKEAELVSADKVRKFRKRIRIKTPGGEDVAKSEVFTISVDQPAPVRRAQLAAELLTQEYLVRRRQLQKIMDDSSQELLQRQLNDLRDKVLGTAERRFNDFIKNKVKGNLLDLAQFMVASGEVNHQRLRTIFEQKLISLDAEISEYKALRKEIEAQIPPKALKEGPEKLTMDDLKQINIVVPEKVLKNNSIIDKLKKKLADLIIDRNTLREQYTDNFKLLRQKNGEILRTVSDIIGELIGELKAIDQHIATLEARRSEIQRRVDLENHTIDGLSSLFVEYDSLIKELELARKLYNKKRKDLLDAETARQMAQREILITRVDKATLPDPKHPVRPILWLYTLISVIVGLMLGIAYAFLADSYDHTIRRIDQAERYLGVNVLASVPETFGGVVR